MLLWQTSRLAALLDSIRVRSTRTTALAGSIRAIEIVCLAAACSGTPTAPPPAPSPTPASPAIPATAVPIALGQSAQAIVTGRPAGTTFVFASGVHKRQSIVPRPGDTYLAMPGAVLDGENVTPYAFYAGRGRPANVTIRGLRVTRYSPPAQMGAITAGGHSAAEGARGWVLDSVDVTGNANLGVRIAHGMHLLRSRVDSNGALGVGGVGDSIVVEGTRICGNNASGQNLGFEAGGTKFVRTRWLVLRGNTVCDNRGPGIWLDIENSGYVIEGNTTTANLREGIVVEISGGGVIRDNVGRQNGLADPRRTVWPWAACIGLHESENVEVVGNRCEDNAHGIAVIQQPRGPANNDPSSTGQPYLARDIDVHDNVVVISASGGSAAAVVQDGGEGSVFDPARNIRFTNNRYTLPANAANPFAWAGGWRTAAAWRAVFGTETVTP